MTTIAFDTHFYIKKLRDTGVSEPQAEAIVHMISESRELDFNSAVTKADLKQMELSTKADLKQMEMSTKADLKQMELTTKADLRELELKLENRLKDVQLKLGGMIVALGGVLIAVKYFG